jgi:DNA-binding transcriptional ArsR family regulator
VGYGGFWALFLAVFAVDFAVVWVFDYGFFGVFLVCEDASFAEVHTLSTCGAFFVVYGWVPLDLASRYSFKGFLGHRSSSFIVSYIRILIYLHLNNLNIVMNTIFAMAKQTATNRKFKAKIFHALSTTERLDILEYLQDGEKCVCEIVPHLNLIQPVVSRHLKILRDAGIIRCRKDGTKRLYSIVEPKIYQTLDTLTPEVINNLQKEILNQLSDGKKE